jgi:hypothetical protein
MSKLNKQKFIILPLKFISPISQNLIGKLNFYDTKTNFLDELWDGPLYVSISCPDQPYFPNGDEKCLSEREKFKTLIRQRRKTIQV